MKWGQFLLLKTLTYRLSLSGYHYNLVDESILDKMIACLWYEISPISSFLTFYSLKRINAAVAVANSLLCWLLHTTSKELFFQYIYSQRQSMHLCAQGNRDALFKHNAQQFIKSNEFYHTSQQWVLRYQWCLRHFTGGAQIENYT